LHQREKGDFMMKFSEYKGISEKKIHEILNKIKEVKVGLIGDLCIDIYWLSDMTLSEISRETPHYPLMVVDERFQLGAGGNVISNLAAINPKELLITGVVGDDWRGDLILNELSKINVCDKYIIKNNNFKSYAYCKPLRKGISDVIYEDPRIDFTGSTINKETEEKLLTALDEIVLKVDVLCVSDQFANGCITEKIRNRINEIGKKKLIVVDSRDRISLYENVVIKPNQVEGIAAASKISSISESDFHKDGIRGYIEAAHIIMQKQNCNISMTIGKDGNIQFYDEKAIHVHSKEISPPIDFCGAGDTFLSYYATLLGAKASPEEAGIIAGMAAEVIIKKIGQTGTADISEISARYKEAYSQ